MDYTLADMVRTGDIVITQDYDSVAMCLAREAMPISQNSLIYTDNITPPIKCCS